MLKSGAKPVAKRIARKKYQLMELPKARTVVILEEQKHEGDAPMKDETFKDMQGKLVYNKPERNRSKTKY